MTAHRHTYHRTHDLIEDIVRACIVAAAMTFLLSTQVRVAAAALGPENDISFVEAALKQGGLFAVMVLVMFFYRRDWAKLNTYQQDSNKQLLDLVQQNITVMTEVRDALRRTHQLDMPASHTRSQDRW